MPNTPNLGANRLAEYFIEHLNRIYCAKLHMVERIPKIAENADFSDLRHALTETYEDVELQISRMNEIYRIIDGSYSNESLKSTIGVFEDAFAAINKHRADPLLRDLSILFYMQNLESIEVASFKVLQIAAVQLKNKQVSQLLQENYDEARDDRALLLMINARYLKG